MEINDFRAKLNAIENTLRGKGFTDLTINSVLRPHDAGRGYTYVSYKDEITNEMDYKYCYADEPVESAMLAQAYVNKLPDASVRQQSAFNVQLAKLIDLGAKLEIPVEFLNPLTAMAEKLASNALEHKEGL